MSKKQLKAIFFDIDDTLYPTSHFAKEARINAINAMIDIGLDFSSQDLFEELLEVISEFSSNYSRHFDKLLLRIPQESYMNINKAILVASAIAAYHDTKQKLIPFPGVTDILEYLSHSNIIKGIITEGLEVKQAEKIVRLGIYKYLSPHAIFISDQIGVSKVNPKIYQHVWKQVNIDPSHIMYVGDHPEKDIDRANQVGFITVRVRKKGKYSKLNGETKPDFEIDNFYTLRSILEKNYIF